MIGSNCHELLLSVARALARWVSSLNALLGIATVSRPAVGLSFGEPWLPHAAGLDGIVTIMAIGLSLGFLDGNDSH